MASCAAVTGVQTRVRLPFDGEPRPPVAGMLKLLVNVTVMTVELTIVIVAVAVDDWPAVTTMCELLPVSPSVTLPRLTPSIVRFVGVVLPLFLWSRAVTFVTGVPTASPDTTDDPSIG